MDLVERVRRQSALVMRLALSHVTTRAGALRLHAAERGGRARPAVLRAAEQRVAELGGEVAPTPTVTLVVDAQTVDAEQARWEQSRIVAAVGRGRRAKW